MEMKEIAAILMRRDGMSETEAWNLIGECQAEVTWAIENGESYDYVADVISDYLGLEPEFMEVFLM